MSNYTKGEWQIREDNLGCKEITAQNEGIFSLIGYTHGLHNEAEDLANAHLIKSSPLLLEALKDAQLQIEYLHDKFKETGTGNQVLAKIQYAINKAEGK